METTVYFAKFLGKKILHENKEYILQSVSLDHISVYNGSINPIPKAIDECRIIFNNEKDVENAFIPPELATIRRGDVYLDADIVLGKSNDAIEDDILETICNCVGITKTDIQAKTRKREIAQSRQMHMAIRFKLIKNEAESLEKVGAIYGKDHATVLHAIKTVKNALHGFDIPFRERYRKAWKKVDAYYPKQEHFNLNWL